MRSLRYAVAAVITASVLSGCSGGSSSGSNIEDQITLPDDSDVPDNAVEESDSSGTDDSKPGFDARRFWVQGDEDGSHPYPGLRAVPTPYNSNIDEVDISAEAGRQFFTVPEKVTVDGEEKLIPAGVFYRRNSEFRFVPVTGGPDNTQRVSSARDVNETCIAELSFNTYSPTNTAIAFNRERKTETNECPSRFDSGIQWHQVVVSNDSATDPATFNPSHVPVVALNAKVDDVPEWLALDRTNSNDPGLVRISSDDLTTNPVNTDALDGTLGEVHRIAKLGTDSLLLAYGTSAEGDTQAEYRLAHYDRTDDKVTDLTVGDDLAGDTLARLPRSNWVSTSGDTAFIGLGNALLRADASSVSVQDSVDGSGVPFFVIASGTHVVWGAESRVDGNTQRKVRLVKQGASSGSTLVNARYMESRVRGTANGWIYFTVARGVQDNGRLDTSIAIGINPAQSGNNAFFLEDAQWIGSSVDPTSTDAPQDLASAPISDLFYRSGKENSGEVTMRKIKAVEDPSSPLVQGEDNMVLPAVTLGTLPESFSAVFMGEGFGPQRLLTAVSVGDGEDVGGNEEIGADDLDISNRVYLLNPVERQVSMDQVSEEDGSLVRALPQF